MQKTLGGDRLGSGKRMKVELHGYERSTHDLGYIWRSTMAPGTLVPFMVELALPGDTFDIQLDVDQKTHPTVGPLFGTYKCQLDVFQCPIRLYQGELHNNKLGIGLNMASVALPQITLSVDPSQVINAESPDNTQINPSCLLAYLGIRGIGWVDEAEPEFITRDFNAIPLLAYWDIYKNYYANKQEEIGYVIHRVEPLTNTQNITGVLLDSNAIPEFPLQTWEPINGYGRVITINHTATQPLENLIFYTNTGQYYATDIISNLQVGVNTQTFLWNFGVTGPQILLSWAYLGPTTDPITTPTPLSFNLDGIDNMREEILRSTGTPFNVTTAAETGNIEPYMYLLNWTNTTPYRNTQEGLALKTYQSDLFNNWLSTEWIDGVGGINDITAIDTTGGSFNIDTLNLSKKVYDMLNRIAVSGGTYDDWLDAVYTHDRYIRCETPIYQGGLIREVIFQEVVSNSQSTAEDNGGTQPLGTLAGKGVMARGQKGGYVTIKVDEPSYIIGIVSLTPRVDYSQGNKWDVNLKTMDDLHKPALDEIGFQELITEQMAWWTTQQVLASGVWTQKSAGKQPAWINYMTNVNKTYGNFAIQENEMFMTLNRRYEYDQTANIADLTTYIDPSKFNHIFAQTSIDAQNFWTQIAVDITARRKMSAKLMPNL